MTRPIVPLPPKGWRPPALTASVKIDVVMRQRGLCGCNECVSRYSIPWSDLNRPDYAINPVVLRTSRETRFDHRPPIHERPWDEMIGDTVPRANDPAYIRAVVVEHDTPVTSRDVSRMAKVTRIRKREAAHAVAMAAKGTGEAPPPTRKRKIQSRPFPKRRTRG